MARKSDSKPVDKAPSKDSSLKKAAGAKKRSSGASVASQAELPIGATKSAEARGASGDEKASKPASAGRPQAERKTPAKATAKAQSKTPAKRESKAGKEVGAESESKTRSKAQAPTQTEAQEKAKTSPESAASKAAAASKKKPAASRRKKAPTIAEDSIIKAPPAAKLSRKQQNTTHKLENLAHDVVDQILSEQPPTIAIPTRTLNNTFYDEKKKIVQLGEDRVQRTFFNASMARKFMQTFLVADACKELVASGKTTSIRDLYYMTKHTLGTSRQNTFEEQDESDPIIEDLEVTVNSLREELHLFASNKGAMAGELTLVDAGDTIDLRRVGSGGWSVPSIVESDVVQFKRCDAKYVVLVEKDAVWRRFNEDKYWKKNKCIIIHGGGQPPRGVRRLLRRMNEELNLPVYVLVDNDPWGFYIYSVVKQGSINLAYESMRMAVPGARFVGLSSFDRERYQLPSNVTIKLDDSDIRRTQQMLNYQWFDRPQWRRELEHMLKSGVKLELEALSSKGISFITEEYFPKKLRDRDWLE